MLNSLEIRNFKNLKNLRINSLGRINLFTGKNNTGKSTILEALSIYATRGDLNLIFQLLEERGENHKQSGSNKNYTENNLKAFSSLFTNRQVSFYPQSSIYLGEIENTLLEKQLSDEKSISMRFVRYIDEVINRNENETNQSFRRERHIIDNDVSNPSIVYNIGLEIRTEITSHILSLDRERLPNTTYTMPKMVLDNPENYQFIRTSNMDRAINETLWDSIALSEKESYVINALKIVEPHVERIAFTQQSSRERAAVIKLNNSNNVFPLRSMGDGINRILTIILALVNADNGYLLIDEFENGLHYTVQKKLWEIIFNLSETLNVQVFATTHSEDCIYGFEKILNSAQNQSVGKLIRLESKNGTIKEVEYTANELKIATEEDIETR